MNSSLFRFGALGLTFLSGQASAAGFGEITLTSRLGEPLSAEVGIAADGSEPIDTACFRLVPPRDSDLPAITSARLQLLKSGREFKLMISSNRPVVDPAFVISLQAGCGIQLQRDYVLMPQLPLALPETPVTRVTRQAGPEVRPQKPKPGKYWRANDGDTLQGIAETLYPNNGDLQQRMLAALQQANPQLDSAAPLPAGAKVRIPKLRRPGVTNSSGAASSGAVPRQPATPAPAAGSGERLLIGNPASGLKAEKKATPHSPSKAEEEERLLKMEATVAQLYNEIDHLKEVLAHTTETLAAKQKQLAEQAAAQPEPRMEKEPAPVAISAPVAAPQPESDNWLSIVLAALGGAAIAAVGPRLLRQSRKKTEELEPAPPLPAQPLRQAPEMPRPAASVPLARPQNAPVVAPPAYSPATQAADVEVIEGESGNDAESLMRIAEIMVSFGREHGAVETLSQYIDEEAPSHFQPWLMLLDLYRRCNLREDFDMLAPRIRQRFNILVPSWDESRTGRSTLQSLEDFPHLIEQLTRNWGSQECMDFLNHLVKDNRNGTRMGFPLEVIEEIALLLLVLGDAYRLKRP